jgi:hypothetical protein
MRWWVKISDLENCACYWEKYSMKIRNTIFDSLSESRAFQTLKSTWKHKLNIYPELPLSKIIDLERNELSEKERNFFYKTNLDYTFCDLDGRPFMSIEFDGMGKGISRHGSYIPSHETLDKHRKLKLDFKLRLAKILKYPLVVISYDEIKTLDEEDSLTIIDGIIGQILTKKRFVANLSKVSDLIAESNIEQMIPDDQYDYIQDIVTSAEVEAELSSDIIAQKASEYEMKFSKKIEKYSQKFNYLTDPPLPDIGVFPDIDIKASECRIGAMKNLNRIGCRIIINAPNIAVVQTVWIRNFEDEIVNPQRIAINVAEYISFKRAYLISLNQ